MVWDGRAVGKGSRRLTQPYDHFRAGDGQRFSGADIEWYSLPAPGIDLQPQRGKGFDLRVWRDAGLLPVAAKLSAEQVFIRDWWNRFQDLDLLVAQRLAVRSSWRLHRPVCHH